MGHPYLCRSAHLILVKSWLHFAKRQDFLAPITLFRGFEEDDHAALAQHAVSHYNCHRASWLLEASRNVHNTPDFEECPAIWDTGASYGLTPFASDFIDYEEVNIPVQDIAHTNTVVGIGTVMWKFEASDGTLIYLPLLCYHLPTADIRLISPQTYHQLHGGESRLVEQGSRIVMDLPDLGPHHPRHRLIIPIDKRGTNLPVIY